MLNNPLKYVKKYKINIKKIYEVKISIDLIIIIRNNMVKLLKEDLPLEIHIQILNLLFTFYDDFNKMNTIECDNCILEFMIQNNLINDITFKNCESLLLTILRNENINLNNIPLYVNFIMNYESIIHFKLFLNDHRKELFYEICKIDPTKIYDVKNNYNSAIYKYITNSNNFVEILD